MRVLRSLRAGARQAGRLFAVHSLCAARGVVLVSITGLALVACDREAAPGSADLSETIDAVAATYVGSGACAGCHAEETQRWLGSQHDLAMQAADPEAVLGDFDDAEFRYGEVVSTFFQRDGDYWVNTEAADGSFQDFRIVQTFGVAPLQQYLVELPGGQLHALSMAWDTRPAESGGQHWFHLYPDGSVDRTDPLHWTGSYQRWNTMCADCHSTHVLKNYDPDNDRFGTAYSDQDVGCEACHGPGSVHAADPAVPPAALTAADRRWSFSPGDRIAALDELAASGIPPATASARSEIEVCARCHSRRSQLTDDFDAGQPFLDGFRPSLLDAGLYHADGQILDEVYVYGSFLQSAMAAAGVRCSDCHEPHSAALRAEGNAVCGQCHLASAFDTPEHHHHSAGSEGAACVSCHMRSETYMVVDPRRDHSFRVPRPDLSEQIGSPNACNDCHSAQTANWAGEQIAAWFPDGRQTEFHYGQALHAGRSWTADAPVLLRRVIEDGEQPAIVRATAIGLIADQADASLVELFGRVLEDDDPLVRLAVVEATQNFPPAMRVDLAQRFLTDPLLALRTAAARALLLARESLSPRRQQDLNAALVEYMQVQQFNSDRAEGLFNSASVATEIGQIEDAERIYRAAIDRDPAFTASYVNLADLYRNFGREADTESTLLAGIAANPDDPSLSLALALSLVRSERIDEALEQLNRAISLDPANPYYTYVNGVALNSAGRQAEALDVLRSAHERFPGHRDTLIALTTILRDDGRIAEALDYAQRLLALFPTDSTALALVDELETADRD